MKNFSVLTLSTLALALAWGCGKKSPASAASGTASPAAADATANAGQDTSSSADFSSLPVVYFDYDQANISDEGRTALQGVATQFKGKTVKVTIEGHCDERGSNEYNLALGERRSQAVKSYLQKLGVPSSQLNAISYGEERPAASGSDESAWAKNRRAEIVVSQ